MTEQAGNVPELRMTTFSTVNPFSVRRVKKSSQPDGVKFVHWRRLFGEIY